MCLSKIISLLKGKPLPVVTPPPVVIPLPVWKPTTEYQFASNDIFQIVNAKGVSDHIYMWDNTYWVLSLEDWQKVISDVTNNKPTYLAEKFDCPVPEDVAFTFGLFMTDGTCNLRQGRMGGANWNICNTKPELLERCLPPLAREYPDLSFEIHQYPSEHKGKLTNLGLRNYPLYHLEVGVKDRHNDGVRGRFIQEFRHYFYTEAGQKRVPGCILTGDLSTKKAFMEGVIEGDAYKIQHTIGCKGKTEMIGLTLLTRDLNWKPRVWRENRKDAFYYLHYNFRQQYDPFIVNYLEGKECAISLNEVACKFGITIDAMHSIADRLESKGYITSEKPWARRRNLRYLTHMESRCEDFAFLCMSRITEKYQINGCGVAVGQSPLGYHSFNVFVAWELDKLTAHILEPQTGSIDPSGYSMDTVIFG